MKSTHFEQDIRLEFCKFGGIEIHEIEPILDWVNAPHNLQQFIPVISNLTKVLRSGFQLKMLDELEFDIEAAQKWISTLERLSANLDRSGLKIPPSLEHLKPNGSVRPDGLIGAHPEYAALISTIQSYPASMEEYFRQFQFVALCAAAGYRELEAAGIISKQTGGIQSGMRDIRVLEAMSKDIDDPPALSRKTETVAQLIAQFDSYISTRPKGKQHSWGSGLRLLLISYDECREGACRYRAKIDMVSHVRHFVRDDHEAQSNAPIRVSLFRNTPDQKSQKRLRSLGLHPEELSQHCGVILQESHSPSVTNLDPRMHRRRQRGVLNGILRQAQQLPSHWAMPTDYEVEQLIQAISSPQGIDAMVRARNSELFPLLAIMLWTGRTIAAISEMLIFSSKNEYEKRSDLPMAYLVEERLIALPINTPERKRGIDKVDQALLRDPRVNGQISSTQSVIYITLPEQATCLIQDYVQNIRLYQPTKKRKLNRFFREEVGRNTDEIILFLNALNKTSHSRWTILRISSVMSAALMQITGDVVNVYLITQREWSHAKVSAHYQSTNCAKLQQMVFLAHKQITCRLQQISGDELISPSFKNTNSHIGSPYAISDRLVNELCAHLKGVLRGALRLPLNFSNLCRIHNVYVAYIVHWLGFVSGYRAIRDPLADPLQLDRQTGLLVISDKDDQHYHHTRIVPLPLKFVEQLNWYIEHLQTLSNKLHQHPSLQAKIKKLIVRFSMPTQAEIQTELELPFLFFIKENGRTASVSPKTLKAYNPTTLPANIDRHYLRSKLSQLECPAEMIDYFMGHWERGEEPYHRHSLTSPLLIACGLTPYLDQISDQLGWTVQKGLLGG